MLGQVLTHGPCSGMHGLLGKMLKIMCLEHVKYVLLECVFHGFVVLACVFLITQQAGIGKSALSAEFCRFYAMPGDRRCEMSGVLSFDGRHLAGHAHANNSFAHMAHGSILN